MYIVSKLFSFLRFIFSLSRLSPSCFHSHWEDDVQDSSWLNLRISWWTCFLDPFQLCGKFISTSLTLTSVHTTKTVTTRQQCSGGVPRVEARYGSRLWKPKHVTAMWFALTVTITCHRSHERLAACLPSSINQKQNNNDAFFSQTYQTTLFVWCFRQDFAQML